MLWLPKIEAAGLPTPKTLVIPYNHKSITPIFDGEHCPEMDRLVCSVDEAASDFACPVFVRTDLGSAKHSGPKAYRLDDEPCGRLLFRLLEDQEMKFWMNRDGPQAILVREFLDLEAKFEAFHGLPVTKEFRFFSDGSGVICKHPYWPAGAIEEHIDDSRFPRWREDLEELHALDADLSQMAIRAAIVQGGGTWSVDFAQDRTGKWWLIDMATAKDSYHWEGCDVRFE